ncbi:cytochrome C oxidase subunit IV [Pseudomaricurvus alkylphenolicus]|jgi:cytochrome c oxidase subunit IV|uniref:cytochrome C oxidase subunit IV family protein n=1 Tax=Pseudomaricurvus alkylphenolicus TaxID=1306991 RepID=UPI001423013D|nr:cytochrome C oxidase subunit IV family protein [Pseudomaricurvus alkylphenolicus]NIB39911.1 cytochrome C oxidase subunit IV [Pseudomaricurvus alkylphenolicus]
MSTSNALGQESQEHNTQEHPIGLYLKIWVLLFVLSTLSYMVDYMQLQGYLRWTLIIIFMLLKAGLIVAVFMHMMWERLALIYAILLPPLCLLVLIGLMAIEADYTILMRYDFFGR